MKIATLIYLDWQAQATEIELEKGVTLVDLQNHPLEQLYFKICKDDRVDEGSPYYYRGGIIIDREQFYADPDSPRSQVSQILSALTCLTKQPSGRTRTIYCDSNFLKCDHTREDYLYSEGHEDFLMKGKRNPFTENEVALLKRMWNSVNKFWNDERRSSRITNALISYRYSWDIHSIDQTVIHLAIVLECLFSPDSNNELSHQIAFNASKTIFESKEKRQTVYQAIKSLYTMRSKVVHGEYLSEKQEQSVLEYFELVSEILVRTLINENLCSTLNDNERRKLFLKSLLFS